MIRSEIVVSLAAALVAATLGAREGAWFESPLPSAPHVEIVSHTMSAPHRVSMH